MLLSRACGHFFKTPLAYRQAPCQSFNKKPRFFCNVFKEAYSKSDIENIKSLPQEKVIFLEPYDIECLVRKNDLDAIKAIWEKSITTPEGTKQLICGIIKSDLMAEASIMKFMTATPSREMAEFLTSHLEADKALKFQFSAASLRKDCEWVAEFIKARKITPTNIEDFIVLLRYPFQLIIPIDPLILAIESNNLEMVRLLVDNGKKFDSMRNSSPSFHITLLESPLALAARLGNEPIVTYLISKGAGPRTSYDISCFGDYKNGSDFTVKIDFEKPTKFDLHAIVDQIANARTELKDNGKFEDE